MGVCRDAVASGVGCGCMMVQRKGVASWLVLFPKERDLCDVGVWPDMKIGVVT